MAAAFIGPGTVTTATIAGAQFGTALLWALLFAVVATIILQEMSARLGLVTRGGLGEALRATFAGPIARPMVAVAAVGAIAFGNAAFQTGNITGAAMGLATLTPFPHAAWALIVGVTAAALLWTGTYRLIERVLIVLVALMGVVFVVAAVMSRPHLSTLLKGMFTPSLSARDGAGLTMTIALIGTTVVPYNLFLHASSVCHKWPVSIPLADALRRSRLDTVVAVTIGGGVTLAVVVTAAAFYRQGTFVDSAATMAAQLEPLLGRGAKLFFAVGLTAAGLTSAITAPLAAAYATAGALGWPADLKSPRFRFVWLAIVVTGTVLAIGAERTPVPAILFAQAANGVLLPLMAVFLIVAVNRRAVMGAFANGPTANVLGAAVVVVAAALGASKLLNVITGALQ